jgi:hypothetical protein
MPQFCTSCGKPIEDGSPFCTACGARQSASSPQANAAMSPSQSNAVAPAPQAQAPQKGSPVLKIVLGILGALALVTVLAMGSCFYVAYRLRNKAKQLGMLSNPSSPRGNTTAGNGQPDIADGMDKLGDSIQKPSSPFHIFLKKTSSDGTSSSLEADISPDSITGQETDITPKSQVGGMDVGGTQTYPRNATGPGTPQWQTTAGEIELPYFNTTMNGIRDASAAAKYVGEEQVGGYDARRYDFDLANAPAGTKTATLLAGKWLGGMMKGAMGGKGALLKDYNVKGSAWISKDDGRMVKFDYEYISMFDDGTQSVMHYEGMVTKK